MKTSANNIQGKGREHPPENADHPEHPEKKASPDLVDEKKALASLEAPGYAEPAWAPSSFVEQDGGGCARPAPSRSLTQAAAQAERPYDPSEDYYDTSATQSFLHDSYYPHLYHQDWHETQYDETDRLQDYYRDAAYDTQSYYHGEFYRDQAEQRQDEDRAPDYGHIVSPYWNSLLHSDHTHAPSNFNPFVAAAATDILAAGESSARQSVLPAENFTHGGASGEPSASSPATDHPVAHVAPYGDELVASYASESSVNPTAYVGQLPTEQSLAEQSLHQTYPLVESDSRLTVNRDYSPVSRVTEHEHASVEVPIASHAEAHTANPQPVHVPSELASYAAASQIPSHETFAQPVHVPPEPASYAAVVQTASPELFAQVDDPSRLTVNRVGESGSPPAMYAAMPAPLAAYEEQAASAVISIESHAAASASAFPVPIPSHAHLEPIPSAGDIPVSGFSHSTGVEVPDHASGRWNQLFDPPFILAEAQVIAPQPAHVLPDAASYAAESRIQQADALVQADDRARLTVNRTAENEPWSVVLPAMPSFLAAREEQAASFGVLPAEERPVSTANMPLPESNSFTPLDAAASVREVVAFSDLQSADVVQTLEMHPALTPEEHAPLLLHTDSAASVADAGVLPMAATASLHGEASNAPLVPPAVEYVSGAMPPRSDTPTILSAPTKRQLQEVHDVAEQLAWNERPYEEDGTVYFADLRSSHVLIQDQGAAAEGNRYSWALMQDDGAKPYCLGKGEGGSLSTAKEDVLLHAERQGLLAEPEKGRLPEGAYLPAAVTPKDPLPAERLLHTSPSSSEKASALLLEEGPAIRFEQDSLLSDVRFTDSKASSSAVGGSPTKGQRATDHLISAGAAAVSALDTAGSVAGAVAVNVARSAGGAAFQIVSQAAREDELTGRMDESREVLMDAVAKSRSSKSGSHSWDTLSKAGVYFSGAENGFSNAGTREKPAPVNSRELAGKLQKEKLSDGETGRELGLLEKDEQGSILDGEGKEPGNGKKPATKRERDLLSKKKKRMEAKLAAEDHAFLIKPAEKTKNALGKAASVSKSVASSSVTKAIAKENEDVATLLSMKDAGRKSVQMAKSAARAPRKIVRGVRWTAQLVKAIWQTISHLVKAIAAAGWPGILALAGVLLVALVVAVVVMGSLAIINENQETSEVSALVAELDELLEDEIHSYGHLDAPSASIPIYYCDARGTYNTFNEDEEDQTLDVDLKDDASDLQLVDASSVSVYTNPDGIIAYIDAKYGGKWQAGAASWKITKEWNGKTYNLIDWENVPEWVQAGLNKLDRETFRGRIQELVRDYLMEEVLPEEDYGPRDLETRIVEDIAEDVADELANVIYDQQLQDVSDEVVYEAVRASIQEHGDDLVHITDEHLQEMNYQLMEEFTSIVGEQEPVALVYDEIVELHGLLNYWSEDYEHIDAAQTAGGGTGTGGSGISGTSNAYGYPNSSGYNAEELAKWDGYNEVSVYGVSEAGTTSVTGDGTRITNDWSDTNMAIACEGLQNGYFAYWTSAYKKLHDDASQPVRITLYNPETGATVTAEVRDCGGWRGFNSRYEGMNATRQWDLLPAVWLALGGTQSSGLMNVYWKVDNEAPVTGSLGAAAAEVVIEGYPWEKETDNISGEITVNRATYIRHDIQDLMHNVPRIERLLGRDNFASDAEFYAVIDFVVMKLKNIMAPVLTAQNADGDSYTDYFMTRRELGDPFGTQANGAPVEWVVTKRFNPGYDAFDKEKVSISVMPLDGDSSVYAIKEGSVIETGDDSVTVSVVLDGDVDERIVYGNLSDIQVAEGDEVTSGTKLGTLADSDGSLEIAWYEVFTYVGDLDRQRGWAYCPSLFMTGFAGYEEPEEPTEYAGGAGRSLADCETIVDFAHSRLGCPYVWGATGPATFDCSGLTQWCYAQAGISIPRNSEQQHDTAEAAGNVLPLDESILQPGDILWKSGHVGIYIGGNQYIHAPQTGDVVKVSTGISYFSHALRYS